MPTSSEMHKIVAARPMVQAELFLHFDAISHRVLVCARMIILGRQKMDLCSRWAGEPVVENDFASTGDLGVSGLVRLTIKALEAQSRGFAHGHEKHHSEPRTKAIDLIQLFLGCSDSGAAEHGPSKEEKLNAWMDAHRKACLGDAATKQFDSAVESARQFGCTELREVFTADEKKRCKLDGGEDEDGTLRLPNVEVVPAAEPAHVLRERAQASAEGRAMKHPYRGMLLTGAPAARCPRYLLANQFGRYTDLDDNGHDPETLEVGATEQEKTGASEHSTGCDTGWIDPAELYVMNQDGEV